MWFTESNTGTNKVARITLAGAITEFALSTNNAFPGNIVSGPDAPLPYVDEASHRGKVTTAGTVTLFAAADPAGIARGIR